MFAAAQPFSRPPTSHGAAWHRPTDDAAAIQMSLDRCAKKGTVVLSDGTYLSGPLRLHSGETLRIYGQTIEARVLEVRLRLP